MSEKIVFGIDIETGKAAQSFSGIKAELKALQKAIGEIDENSNAFKVATQRAGQLRDQIRGVNDAIENADPEKKFAPFSRTVQGLAGGFAAVQGAMGLMGAESKDLEKTLLKVQSAMALSEGLNSLLAFQNDFKALGAKVMPMVIKAFTTLKGALIATGIGAAAIAVGLLAANWDKVVKGVRDFIGLGPTQAEIIGKQNQSLATQDKLLKLNADKYDEFTKRKVQANLDYKKAVQENAKAVEEGTMTEYEANAWNAREYDKLKRTIAQADKDRAKSTDDYNKDIEEKAKKRREDAAEKEKKRIEKQAEDEKKAFEKKVERAEEEYDLYKNNQTKELDALKEYLDKKYKKMDEDDKRRQDIHDKALSYGEDEKNSFKDRAETLKYFLDAGYITQKEYADAEAKIEKEKAQKKVEALQMTSAALAGYSEALGKETAVGKGLAAAAAAIDTYVAASSVFKNILDNPYMKLLPDGGLTVAIGAAAGAVAAGFARVKAIYAVKVPGGGGGGGSAPAAPAVPQFNPAVAQQVQGGGDVQLGMKPQKVYVVESDIRGSMNKVDVIQSNAKIG